MKMIRFLPALLLTVALLVLAACGQAAPAASGTPGEGTPAADVAGTPGASTALTGTDILPSAPTTATLPTLSDAATTTPSGLRLEDTLVGSGAEAQRGNVVTVQYTGYLDNGQVFDSSVGKPDPFTFTLGANRVVPGWEEGVPGMKVGGKRILVIPPALAYGAEGFGQSVPPSSTLTFELELVAVEEQPKPTAVETYQTTENGVEYAILTEGTGDGAERNDVVTFDYSAWLEDGLLYDSSAQSGPPNFPVGRSGLAGLDEGVLGMKVGEKRQLRIPPALAYGAEGAADVVPPDATVIFEVTMTEIKRSPKLALLDDAAYTAGEEGLRYATVQEGSGDPIEQGDAVTLHYTGWLEDGTLFDSSVPREEPFTMNVGDARLTRGVDLGLIGMKPGERRQLRIPAALAFGEQGAGDTIPPNTDVVFEIEVLEVAKAPELTLAPAFEITASGLEYAILTPGTGDAVAADDTVAVHYSGWLEDGTLFDSSVQSGQPYTFTIGQNVIAGWSEGVVGMKVGEKRQLRIPGSLGYGEAGSPPTIPPNATLIFDIELLEIQ